MGRSNRRMTPKEKQYILDNHDKLSLREIGSTLGYSHEWINQILKKHNIKKKRCIQLKEWMRPCKRCGLIIVNDKYNEYCPKCKHIVLAKVFFRINQDKSARRKALQPRV